MLGNGIASTCSSVTSSVNHSNSFPPEKPNYIFKIQPRDPYFVYLFNAKISYFPYGGHKIFQILTKIIDWKTTNTFGIIKKVDKKKVFEIKLIHVRTY